MPDVSDVSDVSEAEIEAAAKAVCDGRSDDWRIEDDRINARADARAALQAAAAVRAQVGDEGVEEDFFEDDEDAQHIHDLFEQGEKGLTAPRPLTFMGGTTIWLRYNYLTGATEVLT